MQQQNISVKNICIMCRTLNTRNGPYLDMSNDNMPISTKSIVRKYSSIFYGTERFQNFKLKLHIHESI